jgi:excisionase family DNA binding protein
MKSMEEIMEDDERISVREAAKQLGVSTATVYRLCDSGSLPHTRSTANAIRIHPRDLEAYARSRPRSGDR